MYLKQLSAFVLAGLLLAGSARAEDNNGFDTRHVIENPSYIAFPKIQFGDDDLQKLDRWIMLRLLIDDSGEVHKVMLVKSTGVPRLDLRVIGQIKEQARLKPFMLDGRPIAAYALQAIEFKAENPVVPWPVPESLQYIPVATPTRSYKLLSLKRACSRKLNYRYSASVILSAYIGKGGEVIRLAVKQPAPDNAVNQAAVETLSRCLFEPLLEDGQAIAYTTDIPMYFYKDYADKSVLSPAPELLKVNKPINTAARPDDSNISPAVDKPATK